MPHILVAPNTTVCEDTPANRDWFERKYGSKALPNPRSATTSEEFNRLLQARTASENKKLRELSQAMPGYERDRF